MKQEEKYEKLLQTNQKLSKEIEQLKLKLQKERSQSKQGMLSGAFMENPLMMTISRFEDNQYINANRAFLDFFGYKEEEIIGSTSSDLQLFAEIVQSDKFIKKLSRLNKVRDFEVKIKTRKGDVKTCLFSAETITIDKDLCLLSTFTDITDLLNERDDKHTSKRIKQIFEHTDFYLTALEYDHAAQDFLLVECNTAALLHEGLNSGNILNRHLKDTPLDKNKAFRELVFSVFTSGQPDTAKSDDKLDDPGEYLAFKIPSGEVVVSWKRSQKKRERDAEIFRMGEKFQMYSDFLPEMFFELNIDGKVTFGNEQGLVKLGYTSEEMTAGLYLEDFFPPEELAKARKNLENLSNKKISTVNEYCIKRKDGTLIPVIAQTRPRYDEYNKLIGFTGILTDISDRKVAEEDLLKQKAFLEQLIEGAPEAIIQEDINGKTLRVNKEFTKLFGYSEEEILGKSVDELLPPPELQREAQDISRDVLNNQKVSRETIRMTKDGRRVNVSLLGNPVVINNKIVGTFGIYRDITDRKRYDETQKILQNISNAALAGVSLKELYYLTKSELSKVIDTRNFFIALYNRESDTISLPFYHDEKDHFEYIKAEGTMTGYIVKKNISLLVNKEQMHQMEKEGSIDLVGTPSEVWLGVPMRIGKEVIGALVVQSYKSKYAYNQKDMELVELVASQAALAINNRTTQEEMASAKQKAEEAALLKQQFMSTMSHEIRTPLNEVIGIANLLIDGKPREDQKDYLNTLKFSANHLLTLVNDVLDYNKIESGKVDFENSTFAFREFLGEIHKSFSIRTKEKKLEFVLQESSDLPEKIKGDQVRLNQILSNLLSNALKFTAEGKISLEVQVHEEDDHKCLLEFAVQDSGIGIPKEKQEIIFDSFSQAEKDTTRKFGGTGLGLAIVKKLVELQEGTISVESTPGKGSRFVFTLPFDKAKEETKTSCTEKKSSSFDELKGKKVLVAEDNQINFFVVNKFLLGWGIEVSHAVNGKIALQLLEEKKYDLVLMDLHMPVMDGVEASKAIRESSHPNLKDLPIIALTAAVMSEARDKIEGLNINDYVLKPFKPNELYDKLLKHI